MVRAEVFSGMIHTPIRNEETRTLYIFLIFYMLQTRAAVLGRLNRQKVTGSGMQLHKLCFNRPQWFLKVSTYSLGWKGREFLLLVLYIVKRAPDRCNGNCDPILKTGEKRIRVKWVGRVATNPVTVIRHITPRWATVLGKWTSVLWSATRNVNMYPRNTCPSIEVLTNHISGLSLTLFGALVNAFNVTGEVAASKASNSMISVSTVSRRTRVSYLAIRQRSAEGWTAWRISLDTH